MPLGFGASIKTSIISPFYVQKRHSHLPKDYYVISEETFSHKIRSVTLFTTHHRALQPPGTQSPNLTSSMSLLVIPSIRHT